jgi:hypothetical protein
MTADAVTTLATGVDGTIVRTTVAYKTRNPPYLYTRYNAASGGSIVNQNSFQHFADTSSAGVRA